MDACFPHRSNRPWTGQEETPDSEKPPQYDPNCYLCPGNIRAEGTTNPTYTDTFIFTNDFSALLPEFSAATDSISDDDLLRAEPETAICRVICYSPRHDLTMARMNQLQIKQVITCWQKEYLFLGAQENINHVQIFENRGLVMGCSNPHPHGQISANSTIPTIPTTEARQQPDYLRKNGSCLLCSYLER